MKEIILTQGQVALVDDDMYDEISSVKWYAKKDCNTFYAVRNSFYINGKRHIIYMHHEIIGRPPRGYKTDHRSGNGLNNQKENLRLVTNRQNSQNRRDYKKSSKYPGVHWVKRNKKWIAKIQINGKSKYIGGFTDEGEAFEAYKQAANAIGEKVLEDFRYA